MTYLSHIELITIAIFQEVTFLWPFLWEHFIFNITQMLTTSTNSCFIITSRLFYYPVYYIELSTVLTHQGDCKLLEGKDYDHSYLTAWSNEKVAHTERCKSVKCLLPVCAIFGWESVTEYLETSLAAWHHSGTKVSVFIVYQNKPILWHK